MTAAEEDSPPIGRDPLYHSAQTHPQRKQRAQLGSGSTEVIGPIVLPFLRNGVDVPLGTLVELK